MWYFPTHTLDSRVVRFRCSLTLGLTVARRVTAAFLAWSERTPETPRALGAAKPFTVVAREARAGLPKKPAVGAKASTAATAAAAPMSTQ